MQKKKRLYEKGVLLLLLVVVFFVFERCPRERERETRRDGERIAKRESSVCTRAFSALGACVFRERERERERERAGFDIR